MWFKEYSTYKILIDPVAEIRPLLEIHYKKFNRTLKDPVFSILHDRYILRLKDVNPKTKLPIKPTGLRVLESDVNGPIAFHEVSLKNNKPELFETYMSPEYISRFQKAVSRIKEIEKDETKGEIRLLSVPALNMEAVWLCYLGAKGDLFVTTPEFGIKEKKVYSENEFIILLNELKYKLGKTNKDMGG